MKNKFKKYGIFLLLFVFIITGCDETVRTEVEQDIYVNMLSISAFVGDQIQLKASPTDETYQYIWTSEDAAIATVSKDGLVEVTGEGNTNIIVSSGDIYRRVPLTSEIKVPLTDVILSDSSLELIPGARKIILVTNVPENANYIPSFNWSSENLDIVTVNEIGELTVVGEGETNVIYRIGDIEKKVVVDVAYTRPFKGPHIISSSESYFLPAANFDVGGEGYAFHDSDVSNRANNNYRSSNGDPQGASVDIQGDGVNLGYTAAGEWLLFTLQIQDAGNYLVDISLSASGNDGKYHLELDNVNFTGTVTVPNNNSWTNWRWHPTPPFEIYISEGRHKFKFYFEGGGFNLRALRFTKQ